MEKFLIRNFQREFEGDDLNGGSTGTELFMQQDLKCD